MRKQLTLIVLAAFVGMFLCPLAAYATKTCPGCGAEWPDDANFCGTCGTELISEVFGTPDIQKHLEYWEITGDVTLDEEVMCLSKNTPGTDRAFEVTAEARVGDLSWTDYEVTGKIYFEPVEEGDSKLFSIILRENTKEKYVGGGGTGAVFLRPKLKPKYSNYCDVSIVSYGSVVKMVTRRDRSITFMVIGSILCAGSIPLYIWNAREAKSSEAEATYSATAFGAGLLSSIFGGLCLIGGLIGKSNTRTQILSSEYNSTSDYNVLLPEKWHDFGLRVKDDRCDFSLDGVEYISNESVSSERGPLSFESVDGCTVYLKDVQIDRVP
jgi:hypothetical protein